MMQDLHHFQTHSWDSQEKKMGVCWLNINSGSKFWFQKWLKLLGIIEYVV